MVSKILIDTNVLLRLSSRREPFFEDAKEGYLIMSGIQKVPERATAVLQPFDF